MQTSDSASASEKTDCFLEPDGRRKTDVFFEHQESAEPLVSSSSEQRSGAGEKRNSGAPVLSVALPSEKDLLLPMSPQLQSPQSLSSGAHPLTVANHHHSSSSRSAGGGSGPLVVDDGSRKQIRVLRESYAMLQHGAGLVEMPLLKQGLVSPTAAPLLATPQQQAHQGARDQPPKVFLDSEHPADGRGAGSRRASVDSTGRSEGAGGGGGRAAVDEELLKAIDALPRSSFESLSKEMLIDLCWSVHRLLVKTVISPASSGAGAGGKRGSTTFSDGADTHKSASGVFGDEMTTSHSMTVSTSFQIPHSISYVYDGATPELNTPGQTALNLYDRTQSTDTMSSVGIRGKRLDNTDPLSCVGANPSLRNLQALSSYRLLCGDRGASSVSINSMARAPVQHTTTATRTEDDDGFKMINQFCILDEIGHGCFGVVKLAYNTDQSQLVAVKEMKRLSEKEEKKNALVCGAQGGLRSEAMQREIAVMKKLRHKNIVSLYEVIDDPDSKKLFLVMQYVDDGALGSVGTDLQCKRYALRQFAGYARQICAGLQYLHNHDVVHRDIKPDNILKDSNGNVYLADFGVSEMADELELLSPLGHSSDLTHRVRGRKGTPAFMAPELVELSGVDFDGKAIDIWALGVTFYCLLVGHLPFGTKTEILNLEPEIPTTLATAWQDLLRQMLNKDASQRPKIDDVRATVKRLHTKTIQQEGSQDAVRKENPLELKEELAHALTPMRPSAPPRDDLTNGRSASHRLLPYRSFAQKGANSKGGEPNTVIVGADDVGGGRPNIPSPTQNTSGSFGELQGILHKEDSLLDHSPGTGTGTAAGKLPTLNSKYTLRRKPPKHQSMREHTPLKA